MRADHPTLQAAEITVSTGPAPSDHSHDRWAGRDPLPVVIGRPTLEAGAEAVVTAVLHEAAHGLAMAAGTTDTSRRGVYHSRAFLACAVAVGLEWPTDQVPTDQPPSSTYHGYRDVILSDATRTSPLVQTVMEDLDDALARTLAVLAAPSKRPRGDKRVLTECTCGRKAWVAAGTYAKGPIICGVCMRPFVAQ
ncbi:hypothetical protein ACFV1L_10315 [Kitasatospora sp. NPDC059646]|uniref:hypothetical protein n=1 Tax=Kitasatospora sp. NPDC059646 TaxID=3346893 RepID=UPI003692C224